MIFDRAQFEADPDDLSLARGSLDVDRILKQPGRPDDVLEIQQVFLPWMPLAMALIGCIGMTACLLEGSLTSLYASLGFILIGAIGASALMCGGKWMSATVTRRQLAGVVDGRRAQS